MNEENTPLVREPLTAFDHFTRRIVTTSLRRHLNTSMLKPEQPATFVVTPDGETWRIWYERPTGASFDKPPRFLFAVDNTASEHPERIYTIYARTGSWTEPEGQDLLKILVYAIGEFFKRKWKIFTFDIPESVFEALKPVELEPYMLKYAPSCIASSS